MKNSKLYFPVIILSAGYLVVAQAAQAVCPVCAVAVGAGVGLSRWLGIDDTITGIWFGALTVSIIYWTLDWFDRKKIDFYAKELITILSYYFLAFVPLYWTDILGHLYNKIWGMDKLLVGVGVGSIIFYCVNKLYEYLKKKNNGHAYFPYQKVVMPVLSLAIASLIFYFITKV